MEITCPLPAELGNIAKCNDAYDIRPLVEGCPLKPEHQVLHQPQKKLTILKCDTCAFKESHSTGGDEYPAYSIIEYCGKGHWENYTPDSPDKVDIFYNCPDFSPTTSS